MSLQSTLKCLVPDWCLKHKLALPFHTVYKMHFVNACQYTIVIPSSWGWNKCLFVWSMVNKQLVRVVRMHTTCHRQHVPNYTSLCDCPIKARYPKVYSKAWTNWFINYVADSKWAIKKDRHEKPDVLLMQIERFGIFLSLYNRSCFKFHHVWIFWKLIILEQQCSAKVPCLYSWLLVIIT